MPYALTTYAWVKLITITRDPRDVIISACLYLAKLSEPEGGWGENFKSLDDKSRIIKVILNAKFLRTRLRDWHRYPAAHKIRYEALLMHSINELSDMLRYLGVEADRSRIMDSYAKYGFRNQTGRQIGEENKKEYFEERDVRRLE